MGDAAARLPAASDWRRDACGRWSADPASSPWPLISLPFSHLEPGARGPGNLHLINGLFDAGGSRVPVLAIAAQIPRVEIGGSYFQETHPQELFRECSVYAELVSVPEQMPRVLEIAMRFAIERGGVAVVVIPGEIFSATAHNSTSPQVIRRTSSIVRPADDQLRAAAEVLNGAEAVTILAGAGCQGAHDELMAVAGALKAPLVHALRGKEFVEYAL